MDRSLISRLAHLAIGVAMATGTWSSAVAHSERAQAPKADSAQASIAVRMLPSKTGLPRSIEPLARYVGQVGCQPQFRNGTSALGHLLVATYPGTSFGGNYACGTDGTRSEHYEGRAVDWMNSVRTAKGAAQANAVLKFLLSTDKQGNTFANARRMGVMYVIWNNRIWGAWDGKWAAYNNCAKTPSPALDSSCHRNHMHISLSFDGAIGRTSYWSRHTFSTTDYGPCRAKDLNWAGNYAGFNPSGCASYPSVAAPKGSSALMQQLVRWSGVPVGLTGAGPAVSTVQQAVHAPVTSHYDARTRAAIMAFQRAHHLAPSAWADPSTWRALLATYRPKR